MRAARVNFLVELGEQYAQRREVPLREFAGAARYGSVRSEHRVDLVGHSVELRYCRGVVEMLQRALHVGVVPRREGPSEELAEAADAAGATKTEITESLQHRGGLGAAPGSLPRSHARTGENSLE